MKEDMFKCLNKNITLKNDIALFEDVQVRATKMINYEVLITLNLTSLYTRRYRGVFSTRMIIWKHH